MLRIIIPSRKRVIYPKRGYSEGHAVTQSPFAEAFDGSSHVIVMRLGSCILKAPQDAAPMHRFPRASNDVPFEKVI